MSRIVNTKLLLLELGRIGPEINRSNMPLDWSTRTVIFYNNTKVVETTRSYQPNFNRHATNGLE